MAAVNSLLSLGVIDAPLASSIRNLQDVRNAYVHGKESPETSQMIAFVGLAQSVASRLTALLPNPKD